VEAASLVEGVAISAAGVSSENATVAIIDLSDVSRRLNGAPISLILGRDYFALSRFEVDISRRLFRALPAQSSPAGRHETLLEEFGTLALSASAEGHDAHAVVDLGNGNIPLISRNFAERLGALTDGRPIGLDRGGGIGGAADRQTFRLSRLDVGGRRFHGVRVAVDAGQNASDLNLGASILRHFHMTLDFGQKQMWLQ
jgi:predicted aspartyl protease